VSVALQAARMNVDEERNKRWKKPSGTGLADETGMNAHYRTNTVTSPDSTNHPNERSVD
jgi:hypothetical protein